jgi:lauroyl/myristoyl acyltransferase
MVNYTLYRIGQFIALFLPIKAAYKLAVFFSDVHYIFADIDRANVKANLRAILPQKTDQEIRGIRLRLFRNFAKYLVDFFRFEKIDREYIKKNIRIENIDNFDREMAKGKGVIVVTAHLGNWELGGVVISQSGYPFWVVVLPHKEKKVDKFFNYQRESKGLKVVPLGKAVRACLGALRKNQIVGLVGDRDFTEKGMTVDFFGKPTFFPAGPAAFCLMTGASIVPGFMLRNKDDTFTLRIEKAIEYTPTGDNEKDMHKIIQRYKAIIEDYIRQYPDQWYMFRKFWIEP